MLPAVLKMLFYRSSSFSPLCGEVHGLDGFRQVLARMVVMTRYALGYQQGLLQRDVADDTGLDRSTYSGYENTLRDYYSIEKMEN